MVSKRPAFESSSEEETNDRDSSIKLGKKKRFFVPKSITQNDDYENGVNIESDKHFSDDDEEEEVDEEIEDYMTMSVQEFEESKKTGNREADRNDLHGMKYDEIQKLKRDEAIRTSLLESQSSGQKSRGLSIMEKMGFKVGDRLGRNKSDCKALSEPILINLSGNESRAGLGFIDVDKSKENDDEVDDDQFRKRIVAGKVEKHREIVINKMMKLIFEFEYEEYERLMKKKTKGHNSDIDILALDPLDVNVLCRRYLVTLQHKLIDGLQYEAGDEEDDELEEVANPDEVPLDIENDEDDNDEDNNNNNKQEITNELPNLKIKPVPKKKKIGAAINYKFEDDTKFMEFAKTSSQEKLSRLNTYLRSNFYYCYYCGVAYNNIKDLLDSCPGEKEEDHC
ncbi:hypothetical protein PACTADRAFT_4355 [Pachysolen tannophilus NRRL Y-2460]|uniref:G-patch domain-containing protein n=1 Tax=Pachysolen tannophilus NRRL Y-2460 TaxID=669874 RepID=A0A1E4TRM3_PACTA|nr:hypothetical protein PACTADRAFT_4355 [Pachysolen tannophilus NRRL Y-2460]